MMNRGVPLLSALLLACALPPPDSHGREVVCRALGELEFHYAWWAPEGARDALDPWTGAGPLVLIGPTGLTGQHLSQLRLVELPQSVFGPREIGPGDPRYEWSAPRPLKASLTFTVSRDEHPRFTAIAARLRAQREDDVLTAQFLALVVGGEVLASTSVIGDPESLGHVWQLEFPEKSFEDLVARIGEQLDCS